MVTYLYLRTYLLTTINYLLILQLVKSTVLMHLMIVINRETNRSTDAARTKVMKHTLIIRMKVCNEVIPKIRFNVIFIFNHVKR